LKNGCEEWQVESGRLHFLPVVNLAVDSWKAAMQTGGLLHFYSELIFLSAAKKM
jgi:hypothetical protein